MLMDTFLFWGFHHRHGAAGKRVLTKSADHREAYWSLQPFRQAVGVLIGAVAIVQDREEA